MTRRHSAYSPYSTAPTERLDSSRVDDLDYENYEDYDTYAEFDDYADFGNGPIDRRWIWVAVVAGAILLIAVICTVVILGGGDSGSVSATVNPPARQTSQPVTTTAAPPATTSTRAPSAAPSLPPETVTTVTPTPSTTAPSPSPTEAAPPAPGPRTITYRVTGNRQLIDLVTIIYTNGQGALQTDVNVALPWTKTVVLDPGVELKSVTATSVGGQLNCSITDAAGATIVEQTNNTMIATCTQ
jgi:hypothetical protein